MADRAIRSGAYDVSMAIGFDKHPPGAFNASPAQYGLDEWYGDIGLMVTTQFFGVKIQRYLHDHDIDPDGARPRWRPRRSATGRSTPTPGAARRCRPRPSPHRPWSATR